MKPIMDNNYVIVRLDVMEHGADKARLENPGAEALLSKWNGEKAGLPFYVFLGATGKRLADSDALPKGQNIGYPGAPDEIAAFTGLLKRTAPHISAGDLSSVTAYFQKHAPPPVSPPSGAGDAGE